MLRKINVLILTIVLGLSAELWVNAVRDPGAELGAGDWETDVWEMPEGCGVSDSARIDAHDSSRAYEGGYSFLTDTKRQPGFANGRCDVWCYQRLKVPKAVRDIDSCFWAVYVNGADPFWMFRFYIGFKALSGKQVIWCSGVGNEPANDTTYAVTFPLPDSGEWFNWRGDLNMVWTKGVRWSETETIVEIQLRSKGIWWVSIWQGQDVSWDNIVLQSIAYYDYAAESIDSDEQAYLNYTPVATFANEGIKDDIPGTVYAEILEGVNVVYRDSQEVSIPAESSEQVVFKEWTVPHSGEYLLRVYPILELDEYSADDTLEQALTGVGVGERSVDVEFVTTRYTSSGILFSFTPGVSGELTIYDVSGREVYNRSIQPGTRELLWTTLSIPSGLYFYKLGYGKLMVTDKLVVLK